MQIPLDLLLASLVGAVLALFLAGLAVVVLAGWILHSAAADRTVVQAFKSPLDDAIAAAAPARAFDPPGTELCQAVSPHAEVATPPSPTPPGPSWRVSRASPRPPCRFCAWLRHRWQNRPFRAF